MKFHSTLFAVALSLAAASSQANPAGAITIEAPQARATVAGQSAGGGFLRIVNKGAADRLVAASAPVSAGVELHTMKMEGDVMRMRQIDAIDVPAGKTVELKPGGMHLMFMDLKAPLKAGDSFTVTLRFEKAGEVAVPMRVEAAGHDAGGHQGMKH